MSDDKGDLDPSDWLSKQFEPTGEAKKPEEPAPAAPSGGFDWGLGGDPVPLTPSEPVTPEPAAPDPALWGAPPPGAEPPTVAFPWESAPEPITAEPPTELLGAASDPSASPIDSLFGETAFKDYEGESVLATSPFGSGTGGGTRPPRAKGEPLSRNQRILLWVAGALIGVLVLVVLFVLGTRLPALLGPAPAARTSSTPTPTPTATAVAVGPVGVGEHRWSDLRGGECLDPFTSVWAETFTVVDCAAPHPAQMVFRGTFPPIAAAPSTATPAPTTAPAVGGYPGLATLQAQINLLCTAPGVINLAVAGGYSDIQFQASYAANAEEWAGGQHDYFCFVTRSSGQPLTNSLSAPPAAPVAPAG